MIYDITFDRIGRHRHVPAITVETAPAAGDGQHDTDAIGTRVHRYALDFLASRGVDVDLAMRDDLTGMGSIFAGDRNVGSFTVTPRATGPRTGVVRSSELGDDWTAEHHLGGES